MRVATHPLQTMLLTVSGWVNRHQADVIAYPLEENLKLGLDLRGGIHLVLQVETEDAVRSETDKDLDRLEGELRDKGMSAVSAKKLRPCFLLFFWGTKRQVLLNTGEIHKGGATHA